MLTITATTPSMKRDQHLRQVAQPEDDDEERIEREHGHRVVRGEQRIERVAQRAAIAVQQRRRR